METNKVIELIKIAISNTSYENNAFITGGFVRDMMKVGNNFPLFSNSVIIVM